MDDARLLKKVRLDLGTPDLALRVEMHVDPLPEPAE